MAESKALSGDVTELAQLLLAQNLTLATAESCTGGMIAARCTDLAGSSRWFQGGVVSYANALKIDLLGVEPQNLEQFGAVSAEVAEQMARGALRSGQASVSIAATGIAGPGGAVAGKPVGTVWFASVVKQRTVSVCKRFDGDREAVRLQATDYALLHLINRLKSTL
ncbi:MAG: CinA family protein [Firmicutes bacterium]|nr:CinA family protein [Bacillota bacterium]